MLKPSLQLRIGQQLTMTPQLQQAIRLLQLPVLDLQAEIQAALEENVMLELEEPDVVQPEVETADQEEQSSVTDEELEVEYAEISTLGQSDRAPLPEDLRDNRDYPDRSGNSLREHLLWQLEMNRFSEEERAAGRAIIDAIDDDGYLVADLEDLAALLTDQVEIDAEFLEFVLRRIQRFDPTGVGCRSLSECLLIQLSATDPDTAGHALATKIAESYLDLVAQQQYPTLRRRLSCNAAELEAALCLLKTLHPKPGMTVPSAPPEYVIPDVFVRRHEDDRWVVEANPGIAPRIRVNSDYAKLVSRAREYEALRAQLQEARWLIKSLEIRNETLIRVAQCIVRRQESFLEEGETAMKPMILKDVAEELGMHESTISRATTAKYMHTPRGVFEFKFFFSSHVSATDGGEVSSTAIRALIRQLISNEDASKPLSDSAIARHLEREGAKVARRTVAKYRESMGIPASSERRRVALR